MRGDNTASLRRIAVCVKHLEQSKRFYETVFDMHEVGRGRGHTSGEVGANHFGFQVDDAAETRRRIEALGGSFFFSLGDERKGNFESKFKDPDGVVFDISEHGWLGTDTRRDPTP